MQRQGRAHAMKAAIYARFSTDRQSETSIADQERVCRARAAALELDVVAVHSDQATSGSTPVDRRAGSAALLAEAHAGRFSALLLESLDRLSRDAVDQQRTIRRLEHRGIRVVAADGSYDSANGKSRKLVLGVRGIVSEAYIDDIREKTHRGLAGQLARGYHAGGLSYGYRSTVAGTNARGEPIGHRLEVDNEQAEIVREIFA